MNLFESYLFELTGIHSDTFISVDIQPEYENGFSFSIGNYLDWLNENHTKFNHIIFLYNGAETLGMIDEGDYKTWLFENGLGEEVLDSIKFYDKGYAFFRYCMDSGSDEDDVVRLVQFMRANGITDSRDIELEDWDRIIHDDASLQEIRELIEFADDCITIPDLMDFLERFNNITLVGGGRHECLQEVEIALNALGKTFERENKFIY